MFNNFFQLHVCFKWWKFSSIVANFYQNNFILLTVSVSHEHSFWLTNDQKFLLFSDGWFWIVNFEYLGIRAFADQHSCADLLSISSTYCAQHFEEVAQSEEFMLLPIDQLASIMASDELNVSSEEEVYKASMEWINYDLANRKHLLPKVLQNVRFPLMTALFLVG